jgi:CubicO group peptidase (beta-lactamase class C family)
MNIRNLLIAWAIAATLSIGLLAQELPRLADGLDPEKQFFNEQKKLTYLTEPYVSASPENLDDGLQVGILDRPGSNQAIEALIADDKAGKYSNLDSILIWKDGKLLFEMYNRRGRVNGPHYAMSVTKTLTSVALARAIHLGLMSMDDLDKPVISFMPEIDVSKIQSGVETITLRDALFMKSGLRYESKRVEQELGAKHTKQQYFQKLFENTAPVTPESKTYKYTGTDPSLIMMIIDIKVPGSAQEFIAQEIGAKFGAIYCWGDQDCGLPKCAAGSNFTSRSLLKIGTAIIQDGKFNGEQLLSADYVRHIMAPKPKDGYYYYFHNRSKKAGERKVKLISGIGAGGQYMATFPELNIVAVATAHNVKAIGLPLQVILEHLLPLFVE